VGNPSVGSGELPADEFEWILERMPLTCVDLLPFRRLEGAGTEVLLIRRDQRGQRVGWALIGGRVRIDESIAAAAERHARSSLGASVRVLGREWSIPDRVAEYRRGGAPDGNETFDPDRHSIALNYCVEISGQITAGDEALEARWFAHDGLPPSTDVVFGQHTLIGQLAGIAHEAARRGRPSSA
jgi:ADP-ribose pyrophosphatase YjhB (NUDIX family)